MLPKDSGRTVEHERPRERRRLHAHRRGWLRSAAGEPRGAGRFAPPASWNTRLVQRETEQQYDPEEDPDTGPATTPDEVESDADRDQAEGADDPQEGIG